MVSYRTVYGIVPYGIGPQGGKTACMCENEACLLQADPETFFRGDVRFVEETFC